MTKGRDLYLLQVFNSGDFFVYHWTPTLAKKGYKVLTIDEAKVYMDLSKKGKNNVSFLQDEGDELVATNLTHGYVEPKRVLASVEEPEPDEVAEDIEDADDSDTQSVIEDAVKDNAEKPVSEDEIRDIHVDQEDILAAEMKHIRGLQYKTHLEKHMLEKYQCDIPVGRLSVMKAQANDMLTKLAKENRLYFVEGNKVVL